MSDKREEIVEQLYPFLKVLVLFCFPALPLLSYGLCMKLALPAPEPRKITASGVYAAFVLGLCFFALAVANILVVIGCIRISQLRNYRFAWFTLILAALPCVNPVSFVPAIILMIYLSRPTVRNAFRDRLKGD